MVIIWISKEALGCNHMLSLDVSDTYIIASPKLLGQWPVGPDSRGGVSGVPGSPQRPGAVAWLPGIIPTKNNATLLA